MLSPLSPMPEQTDRPDVPTLGAKLLSVKAEQTLRGDWSHHFVVRLSVLTSFRPCKKVSRLITRFNSLLNCAHCVIRNIRP